MSQLKSPSTHFFPHGTLCASCGYELGTTFLELCPECGNPVESLAAPGCLIECTDQHRAALPDPTNPKPDRYLYPVLKQKTSDLLAVFPGIAIFLWMLVVLAFVRNDPGSVYTIQGHIGIVLLSLIASIPIVIVGLVLLGEFREWNNRRAFSTLDTPERIEQYHCSITRALILDHDSKKWLILNTSWNGNCRLYFFPSNEFQRLNIDIDAPIGSDAKFELYPYTNALVNLRTSGDSAPSRTSTILKPRLLTRYLRALITAEKESILFGTRKSKGSFFTTDV